MLETGDSQEKSKRKLEAEPANLCKTLSVGLSEIGSSIATIGRNVVKLKLACLRGCESQYFVSNVPSIFPTSNVRLTAAVTPL